ncbi:MAG: metal-binding protein [Bacteroidetes bacterium]|nr:metal-binding protein [Bacteroidota bacterium]
MINHAEINQSLFKLLHAREIEWAGNQKLKIYGTLRCQSGKRMKNINRVFFKTEAEAIALGYRPCKKCMK